RHKAGTSTLKHEGESFARELPTRSLTPPPDLRVLRSHHRAARRLRRLIIIGVASQVKMKGFALWSGHGLLSSFAAPASPGRSFPWVLRVPACQLWWARYP